LNVDIKEMMTTPKMRLFLFSEKMRLRPSLEKNRRPRRKTKRTKAPYAQ
jgi:hypothetical protein